MHSNSNTNETAKAHLNHPIVIIGEDYSKPILDFFKNIIAEKENKETKTKDILLNK